MMVNRYAPDTVRPVRGKFEGIYCHAVELPAPARMLFVAGQIGLAPDGATREGFAAQCHQAMDNVEALLADAGMSARNILRVTYFVTDPENLAGLTEIRQARWASDEPPAVTTLVVAALAGPELLVEIEVTAGL